MRTARLSGSVPDCVDAWSSLRELDLSHNNFSAFGTGLFNMPSLAQVRLAHNSFRFAADACPRNATVPSVSTRLTLVDLSNNPLRSGLRNVTACFPSTTDLYLDNTALSHSVALGDVDFGRLRFLSVSDNPDLCLGTDALARSSIETLRNTCLFDLDELGRSRMPSSLVLDNATVRFCYDGALPSVLQVSLVGARPDISSNCMRSVEQALPRTVMQTCDVPPANGARGLGAKLCRVPGKRATFSRNLLSCPAWSSYASGGAAALGLDAAGLLYWGCECPAGSLFWFPASGSDPDSNAVVDAWEAERRELLPSNTLSANESVMSARRVCVECPSRLNCSPLAALDAPHELIGSRYPL
jgi:hypothetical protein